MCIAGVELENATGSNHCPPHICSFMPPPFLITHCMLFPCAYLHYDIEFLKTLKGVCISNVETQAWKI